MAKTRANPDPSKKGKKTKKKSSKGLLSGPAAAAMKSAAKPDRENRFETIWSRRKFDVLGKKRKGEQRRVGFSRSLAIEKRKKTLLKEYEQSAKSSKFLDRRIGENNETLNEFDKAILRLQRERMSKLKRTSKYNLSDGEEDDTTIPGKDDFEELMPAEDNDDDGDSDLHQHLNLDTGSNFLEGDLLKGEEKTHKTKKQQVMAEIVAKSKYYKAQKAKEKEEDESLAEKLDKDFALLAQTPALLSLTQPGKMNALNALLEKTDPTQAHKEAPSGSTGKEFLNKEKPDAYDKLVKEMVMDSRARPSDRTKTPEEIAQEERERLEKLEEERRKRMLASADSSDEGSDDDDNDDDDENGNIASKKPRLTSGDDLGDSFSPDDEATVKTGWVDDIYEKEGVNNNEEGTSSSDSEGDEENDDGGGGGDDDDSIVNATGNMPTRDWEQSDDDDLQIDGEEMEALNETLRETGKMNSRDPHTEKTARKPSLVQHKGLPFVIEAPNNLAELCALLDNRSEAEVVEAISRIRACNSVRLADENRKKMQVFYGVLLQYFAVLAAQSPLDMKMINLLVKPLIEMSAETPYFAAICARERLMHIRNQLCQDIKIPGKSSWPTSKTLLLLRLWSLIFPCSDFRHVVTTPMLLLMCEYLTRCPIESGRDIAVGSFLCSMLFSVTKQSRRFCSEAITFQQTLLVSCIESESRQHLGPQLNHPLVELRTLKPWLHFQDEVGEVNRLDFLRVVDMQADSPYFSSDDFKASVLLSVVETLKEFVNIYGGLSSFPEIFLTISALMQIVLEKPNLKGLLRENVQDFVDLIKKKIDEHHNLRQPLRMRKQKPKPIKLLNPKFEENFIMGVDYDPDRERARMKKLKKLLKSEKKGAIRELRKDNYFLLEVKEKDRIQHEQERTERYGKAMAFLQEQEHAFKSGQLGKGRKRRK